jgi:A/G-specific adenine glycosylase
VQVAELAELSPVEHAFTHFDLTLTPVRVVLASEPQRVMDGDECLWYNPQDTLAVGVPAPIASLLRSLTRKDG